MRYRTSLDPATRKIMCGLVAKYDAFKCSLIEERERILYGSPAQGEKVQSESGDTTEQKAERLIFLDNSFKARAVRAIDEAKALVAVDIENDGQRRRIILAIWRSCISPRNYPYRGGLYISRRDFYRRRNEFLCDIANNLGAK